MNDKVCTKVFKRLKFINKVKNTGRVQQKKFIS